MTDAITPLVLYQPGDTLEVYKPGDVLRHWNKAWSLLCFPVAAIDIYPDVVATTRILRQFERDHVRYIGDLVTKPCDFYAKPRTPVLDSRNTLGKKSLEDLQRVMGKTGLCFGLTVPEWPSRDIENLGAQLKRYGHNWYSGRISVTTYLKDVIKPVGVN